MEKLSRKIIFGYEGLKHLRRVVQGLMLFRHKTFSGYDKIIITAIDPYLPKGKTKGNERVCKLIANWEDYQFNCFLFPYHSKIERDLTITVSLSQLNHQLSNHENKELNEINLLSAE